MTSGEISPLLQGRFDLIRYNNAANILKNWIILNSGGVTRRPGTKFVGSVKDSSKSTRLIEFSFSVSQTYIIEMGDLYMRFYTNNARLVESDVVITDASKTNPVLVTAGSHGYSDGDWVTIFEVVGMTELNGKTFVVFDKNPNDFKLKDIDGDTVDGTGFTTYVSDGVSNKVVDLTTPYTESQLFDVQFAQTADIMYLVHPSHAPRELVRTSATVFTISVSAIIGGPFLIINTTTLTVTPSADTGAGITLTASAALWNANHVGAFWKIGAGYVKITAFTNPTTVTADVQLKQDGTAGDLGSGPASTVNWSEGSFSNDQGFPSAVSLHEQRLVYAATIKKIQTFYGSFIRVFTDFFQLDTDSDSYQFEIATEQVNAIRWLSSGAKALQIGTSGGTFSASSGSTNIPITASSIVVQRDTTYGVARILPKRIGNFVYYIQRNLKTVRELGFDFDIDSQRALDMTLLADHMAGELPDTVKFVDMAYQQSPHNVLWLTRGDGRVGTLTRQLPQEVIGWARQEFGGVFNGGIAQAESVATIPGLTGDDQTWLIIKRTINSTTRRYVEFVMPEDFSKQDDAFFVDSGLSLNSPITITAATVANPVVITAAAHGFSNGDQVKIVGVVGMTELNDRFYLVAAKTTNNFQITDTGGTAINGSAFTTYITGGEVRLMATTIEGLDHLEGETVKILADGATRPDATVSSGAITLASKAAKVHIGLGYNSDIDTLRMVDGSATGTGFAKDRRIYIATILFYKSLGGKYGKDGNLLQIFTRSAADKLDQPPPLISETKRLTNVAGWDRKGQFFYRQDQPLPTTILAITLQSEVNDK